MSLSKETFIGLRAIKAPVKGVNKVPIKLNLLKVANNSHRMCMEHLRLENAKRTEAEKEKKHTKGT